MKIPTRLEELLAHDDGLAGAVKVSISQIEPWIKHSTLPFFPEYTKHDLEHIEGVLATASSLIRDEAWPILTSGDAAVLIMATLLHDSAMHLSEDGFISLLETKRANKSVEGMGDGSWQLLWEEFLSEASRFDGRKLLQLFGDTKPARRPPLEEAQMTKRDRLLIGEFLRRHHPRLAQEIALFGVPTSKTPALVLEGFANTGDHVPNLSGLVARSHGEDVRKLLGPLSDQFDRREFRGVHAVFLMTLLRVSDYLQVEAERAPRQMLRVRCLSSPVSQGEWAAHHAVRDVRHTHDDPEAVYIDALPADVRTFLRVADWVHGIQREMDASWAVLGEVYGRIESLNGLGLELRRVRSSLDDRDAFARRVDYLPINARFRAADADLLKLLIEPLYGDRPEIGLRELIQNAVDAVIELNEVLSATSARDVRLTNQSADVVVSVSRGQDAKHWVTVSDRGIGMTPEVILDYFLTAGASFRRSEDWRKTFEDAKGRSKILRAGRFGIGALASFLLGPEIEVSTRHLDHERGIAFSASVESDLIELRYTDRPVGTAIRIQISDDVANALRKMPEDYTYTSRASWRGDSMNWDWYCLEQPSVQRRLERDILAQKFTVPTPESLKLPQGWHRIRHPDFADVLWTYEDAPDLTCNGIRVEEPFAEDSHDWDNRLVLNMPKVVVFDRDGKLPLDLQRTSLTTGIYPFDRELSEDVIRDFLAFTLEKSPNARPKTLELESWLFPLRYPGSGRLARYRSDNDWFFTTKGLGYIDRKLLLDAGCDSALFLRSPLGSFRNLPFQPRSRQALIAVSGDSGATSSDYWLRNVLEAGINFQDRFALARTADTSLGIVHALEPRGARLLVSDVAWARAQRHLPKYLIREGETEEVFENWRVLAIRDCPRTRVDFKEFVRKQTQPENPYCSVAEVYFGVTDAVMGAIGKQWLAAFGHAVVPFEYDVRRNRLSRAYATLADNVKRWQTVTEDQLQDLITRAN